MRSDYRIQSETGPSSEEAVWGRVSGGEGSRRASIVLRTGSDTAREVLSSGMLYITGPELSGPVLFRIQGSRRARLQGCMFISAVQAVDPARYRENVILREMREILELGESIETDYLYERAC